MSERRLQACSGAVTIVNMHAALPHGDDITHVYAAEEDERFELQNSRNVSGHAMVSRAGQATAWIRCTADRQTSIAANLLAVPPCACCVGTLCTSTVSNIWYQAQAAYANVGKCKSNYLLFSARERASET